MGYKCHIQIAGFDRRYPSLESGGLSTPHNAGTKIDKIGGIVYNNRGRWAQNDQGPAQVYPYRAALLEFALFVG